MSDPRVGFLSGFCFGAAMSMFVIAGTITYEGGLASPTAIAAGGVALTFFGALYGYLDWKHGGAEVAADVE